MLDLGPQFLDGYIRTFLKESVYVAVETAIVSGSGHNSPIGMDRDIHQGVTISSSTGYPQKTAVAVTSSAGIGKAYHIVSHKSGEIFSVLLHLSDHLCIILQFYKRRMCKRVGGNLVTFIKCFYLAG
jgi:hypothetical protein